MLKYLRIAVTALSLTACVLLIALWVRSYTYGPTVLIGQIRDTSLRIDSGLGRIVLCVGADVPGPGPKDGSVDIETFSWEAFDQYERDIWRAYAANQPIPGRQRKMMKLNLPHWFVVVLLASIAPIPWLPWSKRFGLRTLLIATTLVAVALGVIVLLN
jgi:hypothetical protein